MQAVLISTKPNWCELIVSGIKKVEVRKTKPKRETPFKCLIYCTKGKFEPSECLRNNLHYDDSTIKVCEAQGKVIGEFVCDEIHEVYQCNSGWVQEKACIPRGEFFDYLGIPRYTHFGYDKKAYAWNISNLVIYDKPRELSEFSKYGFGKVVPLKRPPQSWGYVEV